MAVILIFPLPFWRGFRRDEEFGGFFLRVKLCVHNCERGNLYLFYLSFGQHLRSKKGRLKEYYEMKYSISE